MNMMFESYEPLGLIAVVNYLVTEMKGAVNYQLL